MARGAISSSTLKITAIVGMTCNHAAWLFADVLPFPVYCILTGVGGLTFPIMAFLIAEGWRHTSDCRRYLLRLGLFALVSQIPYWLFLGHELNVMFTLFIGLLVLHLHDVMKNRIAWFGVVVVGVAASALCDWGIVGVPMILMAGLLPTLRERALYSAALPCAAFGIPALLSLMAGNPNATATLLYALGNGAAGALLCTYNGTRGLPLKWFFYVYYPAHIAVLGVIHALMSSF